MESVSGNVPAVMAKLFESMKETVGIDLSEIVRAGTYDAKVNRNVHITGVEENGETLYVTKGDAIDAVDAYPVHQNQVAGIFVRELPGGRLLGKCFVALSDNKIYFLVIILPLMLCLMSYFWQIMGMFRKPEEEETAEEITSEELSEIGLSKEDLEEEAKKELLEKMKSAGISDSAENSNEKVSSATEENYQYTDEDFEDNDYKYDFAKDKEQD